jgi:serine/threonine-protein kinase PknK
VNHLLDKHAEKGKARRAAMERLTAFAWPGNVRQLQNEVRRALLLSDGVILVREAMERTGGNQTQAAKILRLSRFALQKMVRYAILP